MARYDELLELRFPEFEHSYSARDTILYALGVGAGADPLDESELDLLLEYRLAVLPSMAVTLAYPGFWYRNLETGLDYQRVLHASERFEVFQPLPAAGVVTARPTIKAIYDKGEGRGALVVSERDIHRKADGQLLARVTQTAFCRSDGGLGGPVVKPPEPYQMPDRAPELSIDMATSPRAALVYRLSGDDNPLHADPGFARRAGFERPILHGLCTYGHIARAIRRAFCRDGLEIGVMDCRFTGVVIPGDTLSIQLWLDASTVSFRAQAGGRTVIDNGLAELKPTTAPQKQAAGPSAGSAPIL